MVQEIKPNPDPSVITTENLLREIGHLKELMTEMFETQTTRADALEHRLDHKYVETADAIKNLRELVEEKFKGLSVLADQSRDDAKTQLEAAFKSANATRDKSEESLTKQIEAIGSKSEASNKATNEKVDRLTSRIDQGAGRDTGVDHVSKERSVDRGQTLTIVSIVIALAAVAVTVVVAVIRH